MTIDASPSGMVSARDHDAPSSCDTYTFPSIRSWYMAVWKSRYQYGYGK